MITLQGLAIKIERLPLELEHVRDIEDFDGPLLSEFRASNGETFLYSWCDGDENVNRWIVVRTPLQIVFRYLVGGISLRQVITECRDGFVYILELDCEAEPQNVWLIPATSLPRNYVPGEKSFHQRDISTESGFQDVFVGEKWGHEELLSYPKKYLDAYAVHSAFGEETASEEEEEDDDDDDVWLKYNLTKGWIFHTAYQKLVAKSDAKKRGTMVAMGVASPGFFRFKVDPGVASGLRRAIVAYVAHKSDVDRLCHEISLWANARLELPEDAVRERIVWVCATLGINAKNLTRRTSTTYVAAKMIASYVDRVSTLAQQDASKSAMLVGLPALSTAVKPHRRR
jgi:hypothetical protein